MTKFRRAALASVLALLLFARAEGHEDFIIRSWQSEDGLPGNTVRGVVQAEDGSLWIATAEGVVRFDGVRFEARALESSRRPPRSIFALASGEVWVATMGGGLWCWDGHRMRMIWTEGEDDSEPRVVKEVFNEPGPDRQAAVWIDTTEGIYRTASGEEPRKAEISAEAFAVLRSQAPRRAVRMTSSEALELVDRQARRWTRASTGGLVLTRPGQAPQELLEFAGGKLVTALLEDAEGSVWVATNGSGLFQIRPRRVQVLDTAQGFPDLKMRALLEDRSGALWTANRGGGIDRLLPGGKVESLTVGDRDKTRLVSALCEDSEGRLWAVKENGGIYREGAGPLAAMNRMNGSQPWVRRATVLLADPSGGIWLGGQDGIAHWRDGALTKLGAEHGLSAEAVSTLAFNPATQELWAGTAGGAVYRGSRQKHFEKAGDAGGFAVSSLLAEGPDAVWVATLGDGLYLVSSAGKTRFNPPDLRLTCVLDDDSGHLWLGSLAGIFRVAKSALRDAGSRSGGGSPNWVHLDRADGMVSRECTGGFQPTGWRRGDGTLLFPTAHGIAAVQPGRLALNELPPRVMIEQALSGGAEMPVESSRKAVEFGPGRSQLEFRFTALSFVVPEKVRFRTRLEGLQPSWQDIGARRSIIYEAVPPGDYVFRVMASNNDGVWSEADASLAVRVLPHFWETLWFRTLTVIAVLGVTFGIGVFITRARSRMKVLHLQAQAARLLERERIAQDLHDDLGASLTEISLIAGLAAEEANTDKIPVIAGKARQLVSTLDEIVWAVNPRHDTLASLVEYLTASAVELLDAAGIALRLEIDEALPEMPLDTAQRHALLLAAREALNNAVKHSGATEVRLRLECRPLSLVVVVQDNGKGLPGDGSPLSEGLRNMRARMEGVGGTCLIESDQSGTMVTFSLVPRPQA